MTEIGNTSNNQNEFESSSAKKSAEKLSAARLHLILDNPFLGSLILQLPLKVASGDWCRTIATDAKYFYYNPEYINNLTLAETQFVLSHEALHCGLSHFSRRQNRDKTKWDVACDYAVNALLKLEDLKAPKGTLYQEAFDGMSAEEIYPCIEDNDDSELLDEHIYDNPSTSTQNNSIQNDSIQNKPEPLNAQQKETLSTQWQKRIAAAAQQARLAGKLSDSMKRVIGTLLKPKLSWRQLLSRYMSNMARDDYSYSRPSNRRDENVIYPSLRSQQLNTVVALDTSGSVSSKELMSFITELNAIKGQVRARITLLGCDSELTKQNINTYEPWDEISLPEFFIGGGGTSFDPVFEWIEQGDIAPDLLIYFTDGKAKFPQQPRIPVIWMIKGKVNPPWGQRIQLNE